VEPPGRGSVLPPSCVALDLTAGVCDLNSKISSHEWEEVTKISDILTLKVLILCMYPQD
jgi:hypothetical protein